MILHRYVLKELFMVFALTLISVTLICMVAIVFQTFRSYAYFGIDFIIQFIPVLLGYTMPYILPVAATAAATFVFSRLSANNEIMAMKASGLHTFRILFPAIVFGLGMSLIALYLNQTVTPWANHARRMLIHTGVRHILASPPPMGSTLKIKNYLIVYQKHQGGAFIAPMIQILDDRTDGLSVQYHARTAHLAWGEDGEPALVLKDATGTKFEEGQPAIEIPAQGELTVPIAIARDQDKKQSGMTSSELLATARTHPESHHRNRALHEYYARYARAAACFILVICGVVVGCWAGKGTKLVGFGVSVPILVLYFLLILFSEGMTDIQGLNMFLLAIAPDMMMCGLGAYPLWRLYRT